MATVDRWLLPDGIEEVLPPEAGLIEIARRQVLDVFQCWGYELVITPHVEFLESLQVKAGQDLDLQTFKVVDPLSGRLMGFRPDITPQVARIDAHTECRPGPARLCYAGSVLHAKPRALSTSRSPIQIGAEFYGDASSDSDLEIICLMLEVLGVHGLTQLHMDLGHVGIYRELAAAAQLSSEVEQALFDALQRKAVDEVKALTADLPVELASMLQALPRLNGGAEVLAQASQQLAAAPRGVQEALATLQALAEALAQRHPQLALYFDLSELRGYHYHTGVVFAAFIPGVGQAIAQGGRYDHVGTDFGRARPATGFSTDLKVLVELGAPVQMPVGDGIWAPAGHEDGLWAEICCLRRRGERVVQAVLGQTQEDARIARCNRQLIRKAGTWKVLPLDA